MDFIKKYGFHVVLFYVCMTTLRYYASPENFIEEKKAILDGGKALAWIVTAPVCEVRGFCHLIESDVNAGQFISSAIVFSNAFEDWTQVETSTGTFAVKGAFDTSRYTSSSTVSLHVKKGMLINALCIDEKDCFQVPYRRHAH